MEMRSPMVPMLLAAALVSITFPTAAPEESAKETEITFQRVLQLTLERSYKIALADQEVDSAFRTLRTAQRRRLPRLGVQGWFSGDLFEVDQWGRNNFGSYLTLDWDFYQNGAVMQMIAQSWANLASALLTRQRTITEEIYAATSLFYEALKARRQVEIAEQTLQRDDLQLQLVRSEFAQGEKNRSDLADANARFSESSLALARARQDFEKAIRGLRHLTREETIVTVADLPREIVWSLDFSVEDAVRTSLHYQPNVRIAEANLKLARVGEKYAKLKRWPSVRFLTGTDYAFAPLAQPEEFGFRAGVILSYPLYDAGDRKAQIEDARSAVKRSEIQLRQVQYQTVEEVTDSYAAVSNQLDLLSIAETTHEGTAKEFAIAREDFEKGRLGKLEMARTRLQYLQSVQRVESLRLEALLARAKLLKSVGVSSTDDIKEYSTKSGEEEQ